MKKKLFSLLSAAIIMLQLAACSANVETSQTESSDTATTTTTAATTTTTSESDIVLPEVWNPAIVQRQILLDEGCMCGVALIGYVDGETTAEDCRKLLRDSIYSDTMPEVVDIPDSNIIDTGNAYELYLIIPTDTEASVAVNEYVFNEENDFMGGEGQVLYRSEVGAPVLIKCNFSDIMPNTIVNIVDSKGSIMSWSPFISLKDGSVSVGEGVYDLTEYIYNETYECYQLYS